MPAEPETKPSWTPLSPREHTFLWLIANGHTSAEAGEILKTRAVYEISTRLRTKLNVRTLAHAAYRAGELDIIGPHESCGTMAGYRAHQGRHDEPCRACCRVFAAYCERNATTTARPRRPDLNAAELRLLRAFDSGRTFKQVCANWDLSPHYLARVRTSLYRKLDVAHLAQGARYQAALAEGRRYGLLHPRRVRPLVVKASRNPRRWGTTDLTPLQVKVLAATVNSSLTEAGRALGIPSPQVSSHLARIYRKLDVLHLPREQRRAAAIETARSRGYSV